LLAEDWMTDAAVGLETMSKIRARVTAGRLTIYIAMVLSFVVGTSVYKLRTDTIFACPADGYGSDTYLAYCNAGHYADYEHGAFAFGLEHASMNFARRAEVLFVGNSHMQVAFSTNATSSWFSAASMSYYLMGFSYGENMVFAEYLLPKVEPQAKVYVINVDDFFVRSETPPVKEILHDPNARRLYEDKYLWQRLHMGVCGAIPAICGNDGVVFRSRSTGAFTKRTDVLKTLPVSYDEAPDMSLIQSSTAAAIEFLSRLPNHGTCVILTTVPTVATKIANAAAIARGVGLPLMTPRYLDGLTTYDGSHLDEQSAQRWSEAFFQMAGLTIRSCLTK
jgi:hypothetical protein